MTDEPCMCGTPFTCLADEHDHEVMNMSTPDLTTEQRAKLAELRELRAQRDAVQALADDVGGTGGPMATWIADRIRRAIGTGA